MEYLPIEKIKAPDSVKQVAESNQRAAVSVQHTADNEVKYKYLNIDMGLQYSAGMEDMYRNILEMFCKLKDDKKSKIQEAFDNKDWNNYTTFVHALKSTSLSIGGEQTSELAKQLEESGKILIAKSTSELDKQQAEEYINSHHTEAMELYDKLVEEGRQYLNGEVSDVSTSTETKSEFEYNSECEAESESGTEQELEEEADTQAALDLDFMLNIQEAFDDEDWAKYSELLQGITIDNNAIKQIKMLCQMITSDLTTDTEKEEAINYIKEHHADVMEAVAEE